jgi:hypothetical protein
LPDVSKRKIISFLMFTTFCSVLDFVGYSIIRKGDV